MWFHSTVVSGKWTNAANPRALLSRSTVEAGDQVPEAGSAGLRQQGVGPGTGRRGSGSAELQQGIGPGTGRRGSGSAELQQGVGPGTGRRGSGSAELQPGVGPGSGCRRAGVQRQQGAVRRAGAVREHRRTCPWPVRPSSGTAA